MAQWKASDLQHSVQTLNVKERVPERHKSIECTKVLALQALAWTRLLSEGLIQEVGILLGHLAILDVTLPVQHPCWDLELQGFAYNCHNLVHLIGGELSRTLVQVNVALLAHL